MRNNKVDQVKRGIEDLFYMLGFKIHLGRKPIPELQNTTELEMQFNNLSTIKKWLEEDIKQHAEYSNLRLNKLIQPELKKIPSQESFALVWETKERKLIVTYNPKGSLLFLEKEISDEVERVVGVGSGLNYAYDCLLNMNQL